MQSLAIATFGIPAAISKVVAELAAKNDVYRSRQLTRQSMALGIVLGIVFGLILYFAAPAYPMTMLMLFQYFIP